MNYPKAGIFHMRGFLPFPFGEHIRKSFLKSVFRCKKHFWKSFLCAVKMLPMVPKITGNCKKIHGQLEKKLRATFSKTMGNTFQNYGQCFLKLPAVLFGRCSVPKHRRCDEIIAGGEADRRNPR